MRCPPWLRRVSSELVALLHSQTHRQHQLAPARRPPARACFGSAAGAARVSNSNLLAGRRCHGGGGRGPPGGAAAMVVVEGDPAGAAVALEGEENVAKEARRLSFDERSCTVNTLEDNLVRTTAGAGTTITTTTTTTRRTTSRGSPTSLTVEICCLRSIYEHHCFFTFSPMGHGGFVSDAMMNDGRF